MKTHSSMLHVPMDTELKRQATAAFAAMGLAASEPVRLLWAAVWVHEHEDVRMAVFDERAVTTGRDARWPPTARGGIVVSWPTVPAPGRYARHFGGPVQTGYVTCYETGQLHSLPPRTARDVDTVVEF